MSKHVQSTTENVHPSSIFCNICKKRESRKVPTISSFHLAFDFFISFVIILFYFRQLLIKFLTTRTVQTRTVFFLEENRHIYFFIAGLTLQLASIKASKKRLLVVFSQFLAIFPSFRLFDSVLKRRCFASHKIFSDFFSSC